MTKKARIYNGEKKISTISGAGKTGQLCVKQGDQNTPSHPQTVCKNKLKMD